MVSVGLSGSTYAFKESGPHHVHLPRNSILEIRPYGSVSGQWSVEGGGSGKIISDRGD